MQDRFDTLRIALDHLPRLGVSQILVADTRNIHGVFQRLAEMVGLDVVFQRRFDRRHLRKRFPIVVGQLTRFGHTTVIILLGQHQSSINKIAEHGDQLAVIARLEVLPREIVVFRFGRVGTQHVTQNILLAGELIQIFVQPDGPVARSRNLVAFEVQELVRRNIFGQNIPAMRLKHRREDDAMKNDVVLADKMHHLRVVRLPIALPIGRKFFCSRYITDRRIKPYIEHLALSTLDRHGNPPIEVATHGTRQQSAIQPTLALTVDVGFPLLMAVENPPAQKRFVFVQRKIPMFRHPLFGHGTRYGTVRLDEFIGRKRRPAFLALVTVGAVIAAFGARPDDIPIGKERLGLGIVILLGGLLDELALVVKLAEELRCGFGVHGRRRTRIDVERHAEALEWAFNQFVVTVDDLLGSDPLLACLDGDRHAVLVGAAYRHDVATAQPQIPRIDIGWNIDTCEVADMHGSIGIRQSRRNKITFVFFVHDTDESYQLALKIKHFFPIFALLLKPAHSAYECGLQVSGLDQKLHPAFGSGPSRYGSV